MASNNKRLNQYDDKINEKKYKSNTWNLMQVSTNKLESSFFNVDCCKLANSLLGMILVRKLNNGQILKGRIVETESYLGGDDKASHSYMGRQTLRNKPMYMDAGTTYVYMTYGMYYCINISSIEPGGAVLLRALEPMVGYEHMLRSRTNKRKENSKALKPKELCNGPSKLCTAMAIDKDNCNAIDICDNNFVWIEYDEESYNEKTIISCSRIGIASAGPIWAGKHLRFYILGNENVSKRDRNREKELII